MLEVNLLLAMYIKRQITILASYLEAGKGKRGRHDELKMYVTCNFIKRLDQKPNHLEIWPEPHMCVDMVWNL